MTQKMMQNAAPPQTAPEPEPVIEPDDPETPELDPDGHPEVQPPLDPLPEGYQQENAETSLDQPSESSD